MPKQIKYEEVKKAFEVAGCVLLSKTYRRAKDKLSYICKCGRKAEIAYDKFSQGQLCRHCGIEKTTAKRKYSIDQVKRMFEDQGCELLSTTYKDNKQRLRYICECGSESKISLTKLNAGQRCNSCGNRKISEKLSGEKSYLWDPNKTDEERVRDRKYPAYYAWRTSVFERDGYTCQCCGEIGGKLNAHHIEAYSRKIELRTETSNGVSLCEDCHKEYHSEFYRNDADSESFREFLTGEYRDPWYAGEMKD